MIQVKSLTFRYKTRTSEKPTLDGISFNLRKGEVVAITGPSGSGKSTLLYLLGGLIRPDQGEISLDSISTSSASEEELSILRNQKIGFIFQQFHLLPHASARENLLLPLEYSPLTSPSRADHLLQVLGIDHVKDSPPNRLSGGQQQRVAIGRALLSDPELILADEPTGALDSVTGQEIFKLLKDIAQDGKTVVIITHDPKIAAECDRTIRLVDGRMIDDSSPYFPPENVENPRQTTPKQASSVNRWSSSEVLKLIGQVLQNIQRSRLRSVLTLLGVTVGIAAVVAMLSLGRFAKETILSGYETLGINKLVINGRPNWGMRSTDPTQVIFRGFESEKDIAAVTQTFKQVVLHSPVYMSWHSNIDFGGKEIQGIRVYGVSEDYDIISNRDLLSGSWLLSPHIENRSSVCVLGFDVVEQLFQGYDPIGEAVHIVNQGDQEFMCRVIGVLSRVESNKEGVQPNLQVFVPYSFFKALEGSSDASLREIAVQLESGTDFEEVATEMKEIFTKKYGNSGIFRVDSDLLLIAQMKRFLSIFSALLSGIAFLSLVVGGMGVTNLMLVSLSERMRELGLRRAIGATPKSLRQLVLGEAVILCGFAGMVGIIGGWAMCEALLFIGSQVIPSLSFKWFIDPTATAIATISTLAVGILSGFAPALKAEKLDVVEALRSE